MVMNSQSFYRAKSPAELPQGTANSSWVFKFTLLILGLFRRPYLWAKRRWPAFFEKRLANFPELDTSRMLTQFNFFHRLFFRRGFETIGLDERELSTILEAQKKGPVIYLMRNWGQVEFNYFNDLFLKKNIPLVEHNNMIKMGHWMPWKLWWPLMRKKIDLFYEVGHWPYNEELFKFREDLDEQKPLLFCLDLPSGGDWMERSSEAQQSFFASLLEEQKAVDRPVQLIPLIFLYDKHPGKARKSLMDILLGERENPGYFRKMALFLRNYKKRAVARIGEAIDLQAFVGSQASEEQIPLLLTQTMRRHFDLEAKQVTGPKLKSRRAFVENILLNPKTRQKIRSYSDEKGETFEAAEKKAQGFLREISSDIRFTLIELWDFFLTWLFNTLYDGLHVDLNGLAQVKKVAKDSPILLVPCHKSHVDYLLLSYVFYQNDLSLPYICAGINLNFWPIGPIFRKSGAYFIRRSFEGETLYPLMLHAYVRELMREGYFQEFFIEGTRSRSGKLFPPKTGLLKMLVESFLEEDLPEVYFVPVGISYERVLEEGTYLKEAKGDKKKSERFTDLFRLPKFLKKRYGKVYLQFAKPISIKAELKSEANDLRKDPEAFSQFVKGLAHDIFVSINEVLTLLPSSLIAAVLLTQERKSITWDEIQSRLEILLSIARAKGARLTEKLEQNPVETLEETLEQMAREGLVREHQDMGERFYTLREEGRPLLEFFKNGAMQVLAQPALKKLCEQVSAGDAKRKEESYLFLESLFSREFFFSDANPGADNSAPPAPEWLPRIVLPLLESYKLTLGALDRFPFEKMEKKVLARKILEVGETLQLKGEIHYAESLSSFNIQNALQIYLERGIFKNFQEELGAKGRNLFGPGPNFEQRKELLEKLGPFQR